MSKAKRDPFEVKLKGEKGEQEFTEWLIRTLSAAEDARTHLTANIGIWHGLYEQATRVRTNAWPDAADLASYIPTEKVDALRSRLVKVVFDPEPICAVDGWGDSAKKASKVEEFHQWKAKDEKLKTFVSKAIHNALIEGTGILEVDERIDVTGTVKEMDCAVECDEWERPIVGEDGKLTPQRDDNGDLVPAKPEALSLRVKFKEADRHPAGPQYRVIKLEDFLYLPGHAEQQADVYGFAVRFHSRLSDIKRLQKEGHYKNAETLSSSGGRDESSTISNPVAVEQGVDDYVEHELWRVHLRYDVDGDGIDEWVVATVSRKHNVLLRLHYDDLEQVRVVAFTPYPRSNSVYGYSFLGHKLWTISDEHTALRNMAADRSALATNAPVLALATSTWDPDDQPWGPRAVIRLNDLNELKQMEVRDVPPSVMEREQNILGAAERVTGLNDIATSGISAIGSRTAREIGTASQASTVRVDEPSEYIQEAMVDLYQLRHVIYKRQLKNKADGIKPPSRVLKGLEKRGIEMPTGGPFAFTWEDLEGAFTFTPTGSVESSDPVTNRNTIVAFMNAFTGLMAAFPAFAQRLATNDKAAEAMLEWMLAAFKVPNRQAFRVMAQQMAEQTAANPTGAPMAGLPPGMPPEMAGTLQSIQQQMGMGGPQAPAPEQPMGAEVV